jgi:Tar ligand binding domain homologue
MDGFKNLNAATRLLLSFGVLMVFIAAISALAIVNLGQANDRMKGLYTQDMAGLGVADELVITRLTLAEQGATPYSASTTQRVWRSMKSSSWRCFPPFTPTSHGRTNCLTLRKVEPSLPPCAKPYPGMKKLI